VASPLFFGWIYSESVEQGMWAPNPGLAFYLAAVVLALAALIGWMTARRAERDEVTLV
jgi:DHA1 family tetracycline resistance protein-like MFS transporter